MSKIPIRFAPIVFALLTACTLRTPDGKDCWPSSSEMQNSRTGARWTLYAIACDSPQNGLETHELFRIYHREY